MPVFSILRYIFNSFISMTLFFFHISCVLEINDPQLLFDNLWGSCKIILWTQYSSASVNLFSNKWNDPSFLKKTEWVPGWPISRVETNAKVVASSFSHIHPNDEAYIDHLNSRPYIRHISDYFKMINIHWVSLIEMISL